MAVLVFYIDPFFRSEYNPTRTEALLWRDNMFQIASYETFQDGQVIFEEGSNGDWIYIVDEGEVEVFKKTADQKIVIETLRPGEIFGEIAYITRTPRSATASAKGRTVVGIIDRIFFDQEFNKLSPDFQKMIKTVAFRLKKTTASSLEEKRMHGQGADSL
jgi:CRP-like cAMP-binding protein